MEDVLPLIATHILPQWPDCFVGKARWVDKKEGFNLAMKKLVISALAVAAASFIITGCGGDSKQIVRLSHSQIETHPDHIGAQAFKKVVESKLGDKFEVQIFPNATLGANEKVLELIKQGSVQYLVVSTAEGARQLHKK